MNYIVFNTELCTSDTYCQSHPSKVTNMYLLLTLAIGVGFRCGINTVDCRTRDLPGGTTRI